MAIPSEAHLLAFGGIIHHYAAAESGIKITLAGLLDMSLSKMLILTEPCSSMSLRNVAKSLAKSIYAATGNRAECEKFCHLIGEMGSFGPIRNAIAHSRWTEGDRDGAIKPAGIDIRSGSPKFLGVEVEERDWTAKELATEAKKLLDLNHRIARFIVESGAAANMAEKAVASKPATEAPEGNSTRAS